MLSFDKNPGSCEKYFIAVFSVNLYL